MDFSLLAELRDFFSVSRHTPGSVQLKVDLSVRNHPKAAALKEAGKAAGGLITGTRFNILNRTLTISYDQSRLSFDTLEVFLHCDDKAAMQEMAQTINANASV